MAVPADMDRRAARNGGKEVIMPNADDVRRAVAEGASVSNTLWLSYLFAIFYLVVAAAGVTHEDLFFEGPVKLPFLAVDLPLETFFWLGPLILLVLHAYVLLHFGLLAGKARALFTVMLQQDQVLLPINIFVEFLTGPVERRWSLTRLLVLAIAWASLLLAPVLLLVFFELQFLPFQSSWITWWHRGALLIDLLMLWQLWPAITSAHRPSRSGTRWGRTEGVVMAVVALMSLGLVVFVATFPGEWLDRSDAPLWLDRKLVAGAVDPNTQRPRSLWSNRIVLPALDKVDHAQYDNQAKLAAAPVLLSLRGRSLSGAVLSFAHLPKTDFTAANLRGAVLEGLHAEGSWFDYADLSGAELDNASLQGASFFATILQATSLEGAQLKGAKLAVAQLQGAWAKTADFEGASLASADLRRATLDKADLRGSNLADAWLQGASLAGALLGGASLDGASTWRTDLSGVVLAGPPKPWIANLHAAFAATTCVNLPVQACVDTPDALMALVLHYGRQHAVSATNRTRLQQSEAITSRIEAWTGRIKTNLDPPAQPDLTAAPSQDSKAEDEDGLKRFWSDLACAGSGAPFVVISLIDELRDADIHTVPHGAVARGDLVAALLANADGCTAAPVITDDTRMQLRDLLRSQAPD